ncbi:MAG: peptidoglycan DD-metalloendopeptidase family protein, partial [Eubacteriaceae bacterium]|nr:peptidoglycan DD-metalloendopeptidase family protein [Eubacteriaceae bacterium]
IITVGFVMALILAVLSSVFGGYTISIDGKTIGRVQNTQAFSSAIAIQTQTVARNYHVDSTTIGNKIEIQPVWSQNWDSDNQVVTATLEQPLTYDVEGVVLLADNKPVGYYQSDKEAGEALTKAVLATANVSNTDKVVDCGFDNQLALSDDTFEVSHLSSTESLAASLAGTEKASVASEGTQAKKTEKIAETVDNLPKVTESNSSQQKDDNDPSSDSDTQADPNALAVTTVKTVETTESIPFSQVTQEDADSFKGSQQVAQQGENGSAIRTEIQVIKGNQVVQATTMNYQVTQAPVNEIVSVGSKAANTLVSKDGQYLLPCNGYISSFARGTGAHGDGTAVDIANAQGTPIYASASGTITRSADKGDGYGNCITLKADDGKVTFLYGHMSQLISKEGDHVNQGDVVGLMGSTGDSTGDHCHFEIQINNVRQHLQEYFDLSEGMNV